MKTIVGSACCLLAFVAFAEESPSGDSADQTPPPAWYEKYSPFERRVAGWVDNTARGVDSFFGNDDAWRVDNESYLRINNDLSWEDGEGWTAQVRPRLRLDLPTASKRLRLLIENDSPEQRSALDEAVPSLRTGDTQRTTVFGLGANLDKWAPEWKKQLQAGVRVRWPLDPYVRFIARRNWQLEDNWELNSYNRFAWFEHQGYSWKSEIKIGEPLAPRWRIDYVTDLSWREERDYLQFVESVNLTHILDKRSAVNYVAGVAARSFSSPRVEAYFLAAQYRRDLHRRALFFNAVPELSFPREHDFDPRLGLTLRLELYFHAEVGAE